MAASGPEGGEAGGRGGGAEGAAVEVLQAQFSTQAVDAPGTNSDEFQQPEFCIDGQKKRGKKEKRAQSSKPSFTRDGSKN